MDSREEERAGSCPVCGYDLRGAVGVRCSECGSSVGKGVVSRIRWVGRRYVGRVRAYVRTVWMVVRRPGVLAGETRWRVGLKDARRFYWVSVLLATLVGTGMMAGAFAFGGDKWMALIPDWVDATDGVLAFDHYIHGGRRRFSCGIAGLF